MNTKTKVDTLILENKAEIKLLENNNEITINGLENQKLNSDDAKKLIEKVQRFVNKGRKLELEKEIKSLSTNIRLCEQNLDFFLSQGNYRFAEDTKESIKKQQEQLVQLQMEYNNL